MAPRSVPVEDRFWRHVKVSHKAECWEWLGAKHPTGYGQILAGGPGIKQPQASKIIARQSWAHIE